MTYDPYSNFSYVQLNKRKFGDHYERDDSEKLVNRVGKPAVKRLYLKRNGEYRNKKAKLFVWRQWQDPSLRSLLDDIGPYVGLGTSAEAIFDLNGRRITNPDELRDSATYYVAGDDTFLQPEDDDDYRRERRQSYEEDNYRSRTPARHTSLSAPEYPTYSRNTIYSNLSYPPTPPPQPFEADEPTPPTLKKYKRKIQSAKKSNKRQLEEFDRYYREATQQIGRASTSNAQPRRRELYDESPERYGDRYRSRSAYDDPPVSTVSDFDNYEWEQKDREALTRHKDVFLNGQGMESQFITFQKAQLEKGMNYVMELIARRFKVNPGKLCDMDGRKINDVSDLMSRGAYILVPVGQSFRDTWYFLPDNAIDTSSNRARIEDRSAQRDRLLQKREKKEALKQKSKKATRSLDRIDRYEPKAEPFQRRNDRYDRYERNYR